MLTIKNINKINDRNLTRDGFWYVYMIEDAVNWDLNTKEQTPIYNIRLRNHLMDNAICDVELKREHVVAPDAISSSIWYKLSCRKKEGREQIHYISKEALKNIDRLLESINILIEK